MMAKTHVVGGGLATLVTQRLIFVDMDFTSPEKDILSWITGKVRMRL